MNKPLLSTISRFASIKNKGLGAISTLASCIFERPHPLTGFIKWGSAPRMDLPGWHEAVAAYDMAAFTPGIWDGHEADLDKIILLNPDFLAGTYFHAFTIPRWMSVAKEGTYPRKLWEHLYWHPAGSTNDRYPSIFRGGTVFDIFNPWVREQATTLLGEYVRRNRLDWVFIDFISCPLPSLNGETTLDLNRDGINHWNDPEEWGQLRLVWDDYIKEIRAAVGEDVLLIPNGRLAMADDSFARTVDGLFVEKVPRFFYGTNGVSPRAWENALDPRYKFSFAKLTRPRYRKGKGLVMLGNANNEDNFQWRTTRATFPEAVICGEQHDEGLPPVPFENNLSKSDSSS